MDEFGRKAGVGSEADGKDGVRRRASLSRVSGIGTAVGCGSLRRRCCWSQGRQVALRVERVTELCRDRSRESGERRGELDKSA